MGKSQDKSTEREDAIDALVNAYIEVQRLEEALTAVRQGALLVTKHDLLRGIFAAKSLGSEGSTDKIKMALELASLGMCEAAIRDFIDQIIEHSWLESSAGQRVFIESKDMMPETTIPLIEGAIKAHVRKGYFLAAREAAKLLNRELSPDEIAAIIKKRCRDGDINAVLLVTEEIGRNELTIEEIKMLVEALG